MKIQTVKNQIHEMLVSRTQVKLPAPQMWTAIQIILAMVLGILLVNIKGELTEPTMEQVLGSLIVVNLFAAFAVTVTGLMWILKLILQD